MNKFRDFLRVIRRCFWRKVLRLKYVHRTFLAGGYSSIAKDFVAGRYSYVAPTCMIGPRVTIGNHTIIGPSVKIIGNDHVYNCIGKPVVFSGRPQPKNTIIGDDVWIGANAIILLGVRISSFSIVAAGAVVTKDVEQFSIVAGNPARHIKFRFEKDVQRLHSEKYYALKDSEENYPLPHTANIS